MVPFVLVLLALTLGLAGLDIPPDRSIVIAFILSCAIRLVVWLGWKHHQGGVRLDPEEKVGIKFAELRDLEIGQARSGAWKALTKTALGGLCLLAPSGACALSVWSGGPDWLSVLASQFFQACVWVIGLAVAFTALLGTVRVLWKGHRGGADPADHAGIKRSAAEIDRMKSRGEMAAAWQFMAVVLILSGVVLFFWVLSQAPHSW